MRNIRMLQTAGFGIAAVSATLLLAAPAQASTHLVQPRSATGCSGNVCMYIAGNAGGTVLVQAWARNTSFNGSFNLTGPNNVNQTSPNQTWQGQKGNYWSTSVGNAGSGTYCVTGNPGQGTACEHVS